ncbi:hypothetical protein VTP01DRAFT_623 [Rhizomucor pusillus]|uniref:uncharacterized protein n=1 Tax=Rhizomucor pusillus TaxID=4840 RepID=UPI003741EE02
MFWSGKQFTFKNIPDLSGKIAIITGSNTGIGRVCALEMARENCQVIVAARNAEKANAVVNEIKQETGNDKVEYIHLDLLSLASVKKFADEFKVRHEHLHILMNNAGVMNAPYSLSKDGEFEPYDPKLTSIYFATLMINDEQSNSGAGHYVKSKAANILFTRELAKRLKNKGIIYVNCNHPGVVASDLYRHYSPALDFFLFTLGKKLIYITNEEGALSQLYIATSPEIEEKKLTGEYFARFGKLSKSDSYTRSDKNAAELWEWTENVLKEKAPGYEGAPI